jgi:hypothetical protein
VFRVLRFLFFLIHVSHFFFSLSLSLFSLASKMKNEKRRERTVSRSNVWI